jgi:hypothetical protein
MPDEKFVQDDLSYVGIVQKNIKVKDYLTYEADPSVEYALPGDGRINMSMKYDEYWQTSWGGTMISGSLSSAESLRESDLKFGRLPEDPYEVVVDELILKRIQSDDPDIIQAGYKTADELLGRHLTLKNIDISSKFRNIFPILFERPTEFFC